MEETSMTQGAKRALVPELRFPEFRDAGEWEEKTLGGLTHKTDKRNKSCKKYPIYSINNTVGFVPQVEQFDGVDSNKRGYDISLYKIIERNTFAYNPARINVGSIGYSEDLNNILISSLYVCFKTSKNVNDRFLLYFFSTFTFDKSVNSNVEGGIRSYLFYENFSKIKIPLPNEAEQQKIADCLSSVDELITLETRKIDALKAHKKGLMQQIFPAEGETLPKLRFPEFRDAGEWDKNKLGEICCMRAGKFVSAGEISEKNGYALYPCYGGNGLRGYVKTHTHSGKYPLIGRQGALCGNVILGEGEFYATEHAVVAAPFSGINIDWLFYDLLKLNLNRFATGQAQPGLSVDVLEKVECLVPRLEAEQQKIADCLSSIDNLITSQAQKLDALKAHKKGLMQQLFPVPDEAGK
ncbi:restriction endonuclease subunit S [Aminithiophilus ramosus]|uniref:Restriction endonuclease subunit S n=1 Tax=Aminithiophilus ramosus TaxID=3029084 RepID=A0A9Q7AT52_9BACT|nr:restriction endonuclease subunit S [Aminithiophilus ramosus]QTX33486.1 restriction endonuclease subunit S [Aminithiophilus ramosus]